MKIVFSGELLTFKDFPNEAKFKTDLVSFESDKYIIKTLGFFLNAKERMEQHGCNNLVDLIQKLVEINTPVNTVLNGTYIIAIFCKDRKQLLVFNDLLSKHELYYSYDKSSSSFLFSDSFFAIIEMMKEKGLPYTIDELGVKMMMWHRMFYDDVTYVREIKFLRPFDYLIVKDGELEVKRIARSQTIDASLEDAANEINLKFSEAVRLQYMKNEENSFPQIITLSGGMDSRSTFLYGLANGYSEQTCYCYGESTSVDYEYAQKLASKNDCNFFFHTIDKGNHLLERDEMCESNEGQMVYSGASGQYDSLIFYNTDRWGLVHTGLGGGEIMGDMRVNEHPSRSERFVELLKYKLGKGKKDRSWESFNCSLKCSEEELKQIEEFKRDYNDFNDFQSLNDMRRCLNAQKIAQSFGVECVSPFLYEDFFCYMLRIPYSLTKERKLYLYWQKKYNPKQFETPSTFQMGCKPGNKIGYYIKRLYQYVVNKMGRKTKYDMVPIEQWLSVNPQIEKVWEKLFRKDMGIIKGSASGGLYEMLDKTWASNPILRPNILTATWALNRIINGR